MYISFLLSFYDLLLRQPIQLVDPFINSHIRRIEPVLHQELPCLRGVGRSF